MTGIEDAFESTAPRRKRRVWMGGVAGAAALLAAAGGFAASQVAGASSPSTTLADAAATTAAAEQAHVTFTSQTAVTGSSSHSFTVSGTGSVDLADGSASFDLTTPSWGGGTTSSQLVVSGGVVYLQNSMISGFVGKQWVSTTFSAIAQYIASKAQGADLPASCDSVVDLLGSGASSSVASSGITLPPIEPDSVLDYLQTVSSDVQNLGSATIAGTATTRLHATIDLAQALSGSDPGSQCALALIDGYTTLRSVPVDVWVDASGLIRQVSLDDLDFSVNTPRGTMGIDESLTVDLSDFGSPVTVTVPPASQTQTFTSIPNF